MAAPRRENIREKILESATTLLAKTPFDEITLAGIAAAAGISKGTLYYYYNNKDDILFDICDRELAGLAADLAVWVNNAQKDTRPLRLAGYILERGTGSAMGNLRLYLIGAAVSGHEALRQKYIERYQQFRDTIAQELAVRLPQGDADYLTWLVLTILDGLLVQRRLDNPHFDAQGFIAKTAALVCAAGGAPAEEENCAPLHPKTVELEKENANANEKFAQKQVPLL